MPILFKSDDYMKNALRESYESAFYSSQLAQIDLNDLRSRISNVLFNFSVVAGSEIARASSEKYTAKIFETTVGIVEKKAINYTTGLLSAVVAGYFGLDLSTTKCALDYTIKPVMSDVAKSTRDTRLNELKKAGSDLYSQMGVDYVVEPIHLAKGVKYAKEHFPEYLIDAVVDQIKNAYPKKNHYRSIKPSEVGIINSFYHMICNIAIFAKTLLGSMDGSAVHVNITNLIEDSINHDLKKSEPKKSFASLAEKLGLKDVTLVRYESPALESIIETQEWVGDTVNSGVKKTKEMAVSAFNSLTSIFI